jgi:hypothetical protein
VSRITEEVLARPHNVVVESEVRKFRRMQVETGAGWNE